MKKYIESMIEGPMTCGFFFLLPIICSVADMKAMIINNVRNGLSASVKMLNSGEDNLFAWLFMKVTS